MFQSRSFPGLGFLPFLLAITISCNQNSSKDSSENELFTLLPSDQTGIDFSNTLTEGLNTNPLVYEYFYNGAGVAAGDFNNDGLIDLYFTANMSDNKFYLNKGQMKFEDITIASGAEGRPGPWKTGVNAVDVNADGKLDIYVCYSGALPPQKRANQLFINTGNDAQGIPHFEESAEQYGLASTGFSSQSYFFDYDKDGDLDMLLLNHNPKNLPIQNVEATAEALKKDDPEKGLRLYKQTNGKFEDVTTSSGINGSELSYGLGLGISDLDEDGWPDFYVSNDYSIPDFLYINNKNGTFTNKLEQSIGHTSQFSMGNDVADINNDGLQDIYTLDMLPEDNRRQKLLQSPDNYARFDLNVRSGFYYQYMRNMLQVNNGNGTFSEAGQIAGVSNTDWSWAALLADYDNDAWKDLYVTNGIERDFINLDFLFYMNNYVEEKGKLMREDVMDLVKKMPSSNVVNYMFRNIQGNGFEHATEKWGLNQTSNSNGAAYADLDNDGDLDLIVNNINKPAFIYSNATQQLAKNNFLQIKLLGDAGNTLGLGAKLSLYSGGQMQVVEQNPARGYLSSVSPVLHFGLASAKQIDSLIITWNSGKEQRLYNLPANQVLSLSEKNAKEAVTKPVKSFQWFNQVPSAIAYKDTTSPTHDFDRQPLLVCELSHVSPSLVKYDINTDGKEDVLIGGSGNKPTHVFIQAAGGGFSQKRITAFENDRAFEDADFAVFDANGDKHPDIYIASGGYGALKENDSLLQDRLYLNTGKDDFVKASNLPALLSSKSCVEVEDINGDGAPDLFVGGRLVPGRYPEIPRSYILLNDGKGNFSDATQQVCPELAKPGMITDAKWVDLNADQQNELVIVGEWMPVLVFKKQNGRLVNMSNQFFDKNYSGWWNKIAVGDFNGDKRTDLVIGNTGLNTQFKASDKEPLELFYKDFDNNGSVDPIFSFFMDGKSYPYLTRDELLMQLPAMRKRFADFKTYADVTMEELFSKDQLKDAGHLSANYMQTTVFLSTSNGKFTKAQLPREVQYSPVNAIEVIDYNSDGNSDLLLFGNNSSFKIRLGKFDANYGLLLTGNGKGNFTYVKQPESGFAVWGDVRSCIRINNTVYLGINDAPVVAYKLAGQKNELNVNE